MCILGEYRVYYRFRCVKSIRSKNWHIVHQLDPKCYRLSHRSLKSVHRLTMIGCGRTNTKSPWYGGSYSCYGTTNLHLCIVYLCTFFVYSNFIWYCILWKTKVLYTCILLCLCTPIFFESKFFIITTPFLNQNSTLWTKIWFKLSWSALNYKKVDNQVWHVCVNAILWKIIHDKTFSMYIHCSSI